MIGEKLKSHSKTAELGSHISRESLSESTSPVCATKKISNAHGVPMLVHSCMREYVRYDKIFDVAIDLATLKKGKNNLALSVGLSSLSFEDLQELTKHFIDGIEFEGDAHAAN